MASLAELMRRKDKLSVNYPGSARQVAEAPSVMPQPAQQQAYRRPEMYPGIEEEYKKDIEAKKGFMAKYGITPSVITNVLSGVTALTGGDPYLASGLAQAGGRMGQIEAQQAEARKSRLGAYTKDIRGKQGAYDVAQQKAAQAMRLKQLESLEKQEDIDREEERYQEKTQREQANLQEKMQLERDKLNLQAQKIEAAVQKDAKGRALPANQATEIGGTISSVEMLDNLATKASSIKGLTYGPLDIPKALNPWDTGAKQFSQLIASTKQVIGKGLEGGVLRKEDEIKYEKIIPNIGDTKKVLQAKYTQLRELLLNKYKNTIGSLSNAGYDVTNFNQKFDKELQIFPRKFRSSKEAEESNLPIGTIVFINNRRAVIE